MKKFVFAIEDLRNSLDRGGLFFTIRRRIGLGLDDANDRIVVNLRKALKGGHHESNWKTSQRL